MLPLLDFIVVLESSVVHGLSPLVFNRGLVPIVGELLNEIVDFRTFEEFPMVLSLVMAAFITASILFIRTDVGKDIRWDSSIFILPPTRVVVADAVRCGRLTGLMYTETVLWAYRVFVVAGLADRCLVFSIITVRCFPFQVGQRVVA